MKSFVLGTLAVLVGAGWAAAQAPAVGTPQAPYGGNGPVLGQAAVLPAQGTLGQTGNGGTAPVLGQAAVPAGPAMPGLSAACNDYAPGGGSSCYFSADYLLWTVRPGAIPTTATTVPVGLISVNTSDLFTTSAGAPGVASGTQTVGFAPVSILSNTQLGIGKSTDYGAQSGFRLTGGWWVDPDAGFAVEGSYFMLQRGSDSFSSQAAVSGNQFLLDTGLTRNLFLVQGGAQTLLATFPIIAARETVSSTYGTGTNNLLGFELNARCRALQFGCVDFGYLIGARYIRFEDEIAINNSTRLFRPAGFPVTDGDASSSLSNDLTFQTADRIRIYNNYVGGQIGAEMDAKFGSFFINTRLKGGVGAIFQQANVDSSTKVVNNGMIGSTSPTAAMTPPSGTTLGGLLAGPADVGDHDKERFGFVSEFNLKVGYQITNFIRAYVGYDGLYMGHFARAGASSVVNTLNTSVSVAGNSNNFNVAAPAFRFKDQDVWVQGLNFGVEVNF